MTCICDKLLKDFFPLVSLQKSRHITQQTRPKTTTWHFADPRSLPPDREKGKKKMTAALDLTSNTGERVRKREGEKKMVTSLTWQLAGRAWQAPSNFSLLLSLPPSIYASLSLSLPLCLSLIKTCRRLGSLQAMCLGWDVKTQGEPKG